MYMKITFSETPLGFVREQAGTEGNCIRKRPQSEMRRKRERIKRFKKSVDIPANLVGGTSRKGNRFVFVSVSLYICHDWVQYTSPFKVKLQD